MESQKSNNPERVLLGEREYTIPEGHEAVIEGCKVIVRKKKSDDWKTRQDLIVEVLSWEGIPETKRNEFVSYLKKQKEQKPAEKQDYSGLNDLERAILRGFLAAGVENVPVGIIKETASECIGFLALIDDKPAGWTGYRGIVIDKTKHPELSNAEWAIVRGFARIAGHSHFPITIIKETAQDFLAHLPAEWTDADEKILERIINRQKFTIPVPGKGIVGVMFKYREDTEAINWLKRRVTSRPEPKQEWSEEDERDIQWASDICRRISEGCDPQINRECAKCLSERLKSLRPQPNNNLRWRRATEGANLPESIIIPDGEEPRFGKCAVKNSYYIPVEELKNLPKDGND